MQNVQEIHVMEILQVKPTCRSAIPVSCFKNIGFSNEMDQSYGSIHF